MSIVFATIPAEARAASPDDLLERFRAGDDAAFTQVVAAHHRQVTCTVRRLMAWSGDCDDVVQDVFLVALRQRKQFRGDSSLATWLTAIAVRQCRAHRRKWWKHVFRRKELRDDCAAANGAAADETAEQVRAAVAKLPPGDREVIVLYYLDELSGAEVAKILGASRGAVDVRLHRARAKLGELLKGLE